MPKISPEKAVEIVRAFLRECTEDSISTLFGILSPRHAQAIECLVDFVEEARKAKAITTERKPSGAGNLDKGCKVDESKHPRLIPVSKWNNYHEWPPVGGLRHLIFHATTNGFHKVIRKAGSRVLIDEDAFFEWVNSSKKSQ